MSTRTSAPGVPGGPYTEQEDAIIREEWAKNEPFAAKRAHARLPHRTQPSIQVRASNIGASGGGAARPAPMPAAPLPVVERLGIIVAWRVWRAISNGRDAVLRSIWRGTPWPVSAPFSVASITQHQRVDGGERDGVHAFKVLPTIKDYGYALPGDSVLAGETLVHGTVSLWGRVIEHERGYRAEFAYPQFICTCTGDALAHAIVRSYGIETSRCLARPKAHINA